ncbi:hypothetical protein [Rathayibacter sp. VKM Ac-2760]|uniref:hypothetical protein n=1 Tax=Rathayibacter sp. VKM Ac-2760 TaxID=2609253 RepID=UPI001318BF14|nr:hypothetical protein [Rathayibacter sp. VKM Ac-2760]QHC57711.1 hypothetical protein GSU72_03320 [Rathayibacter sp. VKM Ac-2760]
MSGTERPGRAGHRRGRAVRLLAGTGVGVTVLGGLLGAGAAAPPARAAAPPDGAAAGAPHRTIENTLLHGGSTNAGATTVSAWLQKGERLSADLHPLKGGSGTGGGESEGGTASILAPDGSVLDTQVFPRGAPPSVAAGGDFVAAETGVFRVSVSDDDVTAPVNLVWDIGVTGASGAPIAGRVWSTSYAIQSGARIPVDLGRAPVRR